MIIVGDIHGNFKTISFKINYFKLRDQNFIQVGDFGIGFFSLDTIIDWNKYLLKHNCMLYVCRGNHDNPFYFTERNYENYSNIKFIPDYTLLTIEGKKIFFIGGAISVDRSQRIEGKDWWKNEKIVYNIDKIKELSKGIDIIITHTAPIKFSPLIEGQTAYSFYNRDPGLLNELRQERIEFQYLCDEIIKINPRKKIKWFYGHFHQSYRSIYKNISYYLLTQDECFTL